MYMALLLLLLIYCFQEIIEYSDFYGFLFTSSIPSLIALFS